MEQNHRTKLAAILAADVVGYSRLMGEDRTGTLDALREMRRERFEPAVATHRGNIIKSMGDGWLVEFASVSDAVACAFRIQEALAGHEIIRLRIGIHSGEVVFEDEDFFGDGINVAARLEAMAEPGGIMLSDTAFHSLDGKTGRSFESGGAQKFKNIARDVPVWAWTPGRGTERGDDPAREGGASGAVEAPRPPLPDRPSLPEKPSVAVLPFDNMSNDPEQEFFADGLTEDLITDLSKVSGLFVVARNSTFAFKGKQVDIREAARHLGVRYVVEGSVRKAGSRVRINVQLIDAENGGHIWAERYDGSIDDVFELQDDVGVKVVSALSVRLSGDEKKRLSQVHTHDLAAYELFVRARATPYPPVPGRIAAARQMFERVIEMDPTFAGGHAGVSMMTSLAALFSHADLTDTAATATDLARKAIAVDESFGWSYVSLGLGLMLQGRHDEAIEAVAKAVERQPNDPEANGYQGLLLGFAGYPERGFEPIDRAIRLSPQFVNSPFLNLKGFVKLMAGDYSGAVEAFEENIRREGPIGPPALAMAAAAHWALDEKDEARRLVNRLTTEFSAFGLENYNFLMLNRRPEVGAHLRGLMSAAGVPD